MAKAPAKPEAPTPVGLISTANAARLCECTPEWIRKLSREGWIKKQGPDQFLVIDVVQGMLRYMRDEARKSTKSAAASRVQDARAQAIELENEREAGKLYAAEDVEGTWFEIVSTLRGELNGCPASVSRDLEVRNAVDEYINGALGRAEAKFAKAVTSRFADTEGALEEEAPVS